MNKGLIKFKYGEEIIAEYEKTANGLYVQNTAALLPTENFQFHLVTWMPYTNIRAGFVIPASEIWFITDLAEDMDTYYERWKVSVELKLKEQNSKTVEEQEVTQ